MEYGRRELGRVETMIAELDKLTDIQWFQFASAITSVYSNGGERVASPCAATWRVTLSMSTAGHIGHVPACPHQKCPVQWCSNGVGRVGKVQLASECRGPEFQAKIFYNNFPVTVGIRTDFWLWIAQKCVWWLDWIRLYLNVWNIFALNSTQIDTVSLLYPQHSCDRIVTIEYVTSLIGVTSYGALGHVPPLELGHAKKIWQFLR